MAQRVCYRRQVIGPFRDLTCTQVAVSHEVVPGRQDLPKSATTPCWYSECRESRFLALLTGII